MKSRSKRNSKKVTEAAPGAEAEPGSIYADEGPAKELSREDKLELSQPLGVKDDILPPPKSPPPSPRRDRLRKIKEGLNKVENRKEIQDFLDEGLGDDIDFTNPAFEGALAALKSSVGDLNVYGQKLKNEGRADKGDLLIAMAKDLNAVISAHKDSIIKSDRSRDDVVAAVDNLKKGFLSKLHTHDAQLGKHNKEYKVIIANIMLALTGIGALLVVGHLAVSKLSTGKASLLFSKTTSMNKVDSVEKTLHRTVKKITK